MNAAWLTLEPEEEAEEEEEEEAEVERAFAESGASSAVVVEGMLEMFEGEERAERADEEA